MPRIVDLSVAIENDVPSDPPVYLPKVEYLTHKDTLPTWAKRYKDLDPAELPNGEASAIERVNLITHNGTHVDAPWHYASTMTDGKRSATIDEMPLDWFFRPAIKLDFRHFASGYVVQPPDIERELSRIGYSLQPYDIVMVNTCAGARYGQEDYIYSGCGMGRDATLYLTSRGIKVTGTDAWSWDAPYKFMAERFEKDRNAKKIWEGHKAGREIAYCHIEKLHALEQLPSHGFRVACFPVKIRAASAGWTRAVAIFDQ
jgi:kynurenine formamidase